MAITAEVIGINRNAPIDANAIRLYSTGAEGGSGLTLGQLSVAVCMGAASAYEAQSVLKMNFVTSGSAMLEEASAWLEKVADGSATWDEAKAFCVNSLGIDEGDLPDTIDTYEKRMRVFTRMKDKMDLLATTQQEDMIDLQTMVNRRDVAYSTSSNIMKALYTSSSGNAGNF